MRRNKIVILLPGMLGSGCTSVARLLADRLGLKIINSESIIREIVSERGASFLEMAAMVRDGEVDLEGIIRSIALDYINEGDVIVEGRTALTLLDKPATIKAFLYADKSYRAKRVAERREISLEEAEREVERSDEDRRRLVERLYNHDWLDPSLYDVVVNTSRIPVERGVEVIEAYCKLCSLEP